MGYFKKVLVVGLLLALAGAAVYIAFSPSGVDVRRVEFFNSHGGRLVGDLYLPGKIPGPLPGAVLCHGVELSKETMAQLGVEFAKRGFAALAFDYGGYGESDPHGGELDAMVDDTMAALKFLDGLDETSGPGLVGMVGHSMGVTYSIAAASDVNDVAAVVGMGNEAITDSVPPNNVALAMGVYEEFHTMADMLEAVRQSENVKTLKPDEIVGEFKYGAARALLVSPLSDHGIEPFDPILIRKTMMWFGRAMPKITIPEMKVTETYRTQGYVLLYFGLLFAAVAIIALISTPRMAAGGSGKPLLSLRAYFLPIAAAGIAANLAGPRATLFLTDLSMIIFVGGSIGSAIARKGSAEPDSEKAFEAAGAAFRTGGGYWLLVIGIFFICLIVGGIVPAVKYGYIVYLPGFLFYTLSLLPYLIVNMLRTDMFFRYSEAWIPGIFLAAAMAAEFIRPGVVTELLSKAIMATIRAFHFRGPFRIFSSKKELIAAIVMFAILAAVLATRLREGWLTAEALRPMMAISLKYMILPLVLFIIAVNIRRRDG